MRHIQINYKSKKLAHDLPYLDEEFVNYSEGTLFSIIKNVLDKGYGVFVRHVGRITYVVIDTSKTK